MIRTILACVLLTLSTFTLAQDSQRLSAEVLWELARVASPVISPDGTRVVVAVTTHPENEDDPEKSFEAETRLWLLATDSSQVQRPLTAEGSRASDAVFSPDGSHLAFVSKRDADEAGQLYVLPMNEPGEAVKLVDIPTGVSALKWIGDYIYFVSSVWPEKTFEEMAEAIDAEKKSKVSAKVWTAMPYSYWDHWLDEARQHHLFRILATGGDVDSLTLASKLQLPRAEAGTGEYDVSPDGKLLAFVANSRTGGVYADLDVFLLEVGSTDAVNITEGNEARDGQPMFAANNRLLAYSRQSIPGFYADETKLIVRDLHSGDTRTLHEEWDRSAAGVIWAPDSKGFYGAIDDAGVRRIYFLPLDGAPVRITDSTDFGGLSIAKDGTLVARNQSAVYPPRVVRVESRGSVVSRLDTFNDDVMADVDIGSTESVTYTGADGDEIQMWVHYPPGFDSSKQYPLLMMIHGGPHGAVTDDFHFRWNSQTFASWGYVTAWPNFHGSTGFGQEFTDSINPDWATKPYADVIAAADWLSDQRWIDSDRMVAAGGSYGGYLSSILLSRDHPFKALVIHAAVYDMYAQTSADFAVHMERFGPYWETPEIYAEISPHLYADKFKTPSLVIHGQKDLRVPVGQGFELFRALQTRGVESRLVYYPDENHWVLTRENSVYWYREVEDWVNRFAAPGPR
jgi:dipeptidyl aminopeptidase/acylaminoacyl peptidase